MTEQQLADTNLPVHAVQLELDRIVCRRIIAETRELLRSVGAGKR